MKKTIRNLMLVMVITVLCMVMAITAGATTEDGFVYTVSNGEVTITGYEGSSTDIVIPEEIEGCSVTTIKDLEGSDPFSGVVSITVPACVTFIEDDAFGSFENLEKIIIDENNPEYSSDEYGVWFNKDKTVLKLYPCGRKDLSYKIPDSVEVIPSFSVVSEILENVELPENLRIIEDYAFAWSTMALNDKIYLSEKVEKVGAGAFLYSLFIQDIYIEGMNTEVSEASFYFNEIYIDGISKKDFLVLYKQALETEDAELAEKVMQYMKEADYKHEGYYTGTIYCHAGSLAEACAIENDLDYVLTHFYDDEWNYDCADGCRWRKCIHCDEIEIEDHDMGEYVITKAATCTEKGEEKADCSRCDYSTTRETALVDHSYITSVIAPTCTEGGYTKYTCVCGDSYTTDEISSLGHEMGEYVVSKEATCAEMGEESAECSNCDYCEVKKIPLISHNDEDLDGYCDSCNAYIADEDCICVCHAKTIGAFVYKLFRFLDKFLKTSLVDRVFKIDDICVCGIKH